MHYASAHLSSYCLCTESLIGVKRAGVEIQKALGSRYPSLDERIHLGNFEMIGKHVKNLPTQ